MNYTYDFNYSMHLDSMPKANNANTHQERQFMTAAKQFVEGELVKEKGIIEFVRLLIRQNIFIKIGNLMMEIS